MTRFVAEITLRTEPIEAADKEEARRIIDRDLWERLPVHPRAVVEVVVTELEDTDP